MCHEFFVTDVILKLTFSKPKYSKPNISDIRYLIWNHHFYVQNTNGYVCSAMFGRN